MARSEEACGMNNANKPYAAVKTGPEAPTLEDQILSLQREKSALYTENWALRQAIKDLTEDKWESQAEYQHQWLAAKVQRQRWAINAIQWRGWEPEYIIWEMEDPRDQD